jgi:hypothetical protein
MTAATEAQVFVSRFPELDAAAPERLVRIRGRHCSDVEMVLRFRKGSLDYEHVLEGGAASSYPLLQLIQHSFGSNTFTPKELYQTTGIARATAFRQIDRLCRGDVLRKCRHGEYKLLELK